MLQLAWVSGGALGVLLPHDTFCLGFGIVAGVMVLVGIQAALVGRGRTLLPFLGPAAHAAAARPPSRESAFRYASSRSGTASPAFRHVSPAFRHGT